MLKSVGVIVRKVFGVGVPALFSALRLDDLNTCLCILEKYKRYLEGF